MKAAAALTFNIYSTDASTTSQPVLSTLSAAHSHAGQKIPPLNELSVKAEVFISNVSLAGRQLLRGVLAAATASPS